MLSCTVTKPVKTGEMAFEVKQYKLATELLEKEFNASRTDEAKARKSRLLALSHTILQNHGDALRWYDLADQYYRTENSSLELAQSLKRNERYKDAAQLFEEMYRKYRVQDYLRESKLCQEAIRQQDRMNEFKVESFPVNSKASDYSPVLFDEDFIVFSSDRQGSTGNREYKWNGRAFSDLFVSDKNGRQIYGFDALINTEHNEGAACFSNDFQEMFFTRCVSTETRDQRCKIFYSQRPNGFWLEPEALMFFDDNTNFGHPCLIENDSVLVFSARLPNSDNYDLYYSVKVGKAWSEAELMPSSINTIGDEKFPTYSDGILYFSSTGHPGFGGLDIFESSLGADGSWSRARNLGIPINSGADDFGLVVTGKNRVGANVALEGFFTSSRNTMLSDEIFRFTQYLPKEQVEVEEDLVSEPEKRKDYLVYISGRVLENIYEDGNPNKPRIERKPIDDVRVEIVFEEDTIIENTRKGNFLHQVSSESRHKIRVRAKDFLNTQVDVTIPPFASLDADTTINITIGLDRIVYDTEIIISNIYYDFDKWDIRKDAEAPLDSLYEVLKLNPQLDIELASHTDCRGDEAYNRELSLKRAESVVSYLSSKGLEAERFTAVGYGESKPSVQCPCEQCTEDQHQANRRTTFKILRP